MKKTLVTLFTLVAMSIGVQASFAAPCPCSQAIGPCCHPVCPAAACPCPACPVAQPCCDPCAAPCPACPCQSSCGSCCNNYNNFSDNCGCGCCRKKCSWWKFWENKNCCDRCDNCNSCGCDCCN